MKTIGLNLLIGLGLLALGTGAGVAWEGHRGATALSGIQADLATCRAAAATQQTALSVLKKLNAERLAQAQAQARQTAQALHERDALQQILDHRTTTRFATTSQVAHENLECQALAAMPVCPAVAARLWGNDTGAVSVRDTRASY